MITEETVLIIGAGASMPYQFPSGERLLFNICRELGNSKNVNILELCGFEKSLIHDFNEALFLSGRSSVDAFLEHRTEFLEVGKHAIAQFLIPFEQPKVLFSQEEGGMGEYGENRKWYRYLFGKMNTSFKDFGENKISFITFNYDRSLEHFLFTALLNSYGKSKDEVAAKLNQLEIVHIHGHLGDLPWQDPNNGREYHNGISPSEVKAAGKNVKIIHESISGDPGFAKAHELIKLARKIYFLGFGYHSTNLRRILPNFSEEKRIWGTAIGMSDLEKNDVRRDSQKVIRTKDLYHLGIVDLFRNVAPLESP